MPSVQAVLLYFSCLLQLITAFAASATASNWQRIGKPFNPLLGETYELDRQVFLILQLVYMGIWRFNFFRTP
jgi:hypothetical protein